MISGIETVAEALIGLAEKGCFQKRIIYHKDGVTPYLTRYLVGAGVSSRDDELKALFGQKDTDSSKFYEKVGALQEPGLIYLHHIHTADSECIPHNHPWEGSSLILRGAYREALYPMDWGPAGEDIQYQPGWVYASHDMDDLRPIITWHRPGTRLKIRSNIPHRVSDVTPGGAWTLVRTTDRFRKWGFFIPVVVPLGATKDNVLDHEGNQFSTKIRDPMVCYAEWTEAPGEIPEFDFWDCGEELSRRDIIAASHWVYCPWNLYNGNFFLQGAKQAKKRANEINKLHVGAERMKKKEQP